MIKNSETAAARAARRILKRNARRQMVDAKESLNKAGLPKTVYGNWSTGVDGTKFFAAEPDPEALVMVGEKKLVGEYRLFRMVEVERATIVRINNSPGRKR